MPDGIILKGIGGFYYVKTANGIIECKARGILRQGESVPVTGDNVIVEYLNGQTNKGVINVIKERYSILVRPPVANVNQVFIVMSCVNPDPDLMLIDKLIVAATVRNIDAYIIINKIDLTEMDLVNNICSQYKDAVKGIVPTSIISGEGLVEISRLMAGKISVFAGQSGVGKSSIINNILDNVVMETGILGEKSNRGKHTTRHSELFELKNGGYILDSSGFSSYEIEEVQYDELWRHYPEMKRIEQSCRFKGCLHSSEPSCTVKQAVEDGFIHRQRYDRYLQLLTVLKNNYDNRWRK